jgi:hypothetical protein
MVLLGTGRAAAERLPSFDLVKAVVFEHFNEIEDVKEALIVARPEVAGLFPKLKRLGWTVADAGDILDDVLPADAFLVKKLRTKKGAKFSRQIARYPEGYDRLDRFSRLPRGHSLVDDLIEGPDGYKLIKYMTTAKGGTNLGKQLSNAPLGKDFNKPTGKIYTLRMLLDRLKASYKEAAGRKRKPSP